MKIGGYRSGSFTHRPCRPCLTRTCRSRSFITDQRHSALDDSRQGGRSLVHVVVGVSSIPGRFQMPMTGTSEDLSMVSDIPSQSDKARIFRLLHAERDGFVVPNPWDVGSARLLSQLGFKALATTSAGYAFSSGRPDNSVSRDRLLIHLAEIASATSLPVSADLENGFGDAPEEAARTIRLARRRSRRGGRVHRGLACRPR